MIASAVAKLIDEIPFKPYKIVSFSSSGKNPLSALLMSGRPILTPAFCNVAIAVPNLT